MHTRSSLVGLAVVVIVAVVVVALTIFASIVVIGVDSVATLP